MNLRKLARGRECTVRIFSVCNGDPETTVLAHLNGGGMGRKRHDLVACWACSDCHAWLDGGYAQMGDDRATRDLVHLEAVVRTQEVLIEEGVITW